MTGHPVTTKVCIVDDEFEIAEMCSEMLGPKYATSCFSSAKEALKEYELPKIPDILITDIKMPGMSGADFIKELREKKVNRPVIVISGHWDMIEALRGQDKEVLAFLKKPFTPTQLRAVVAQAEELAQAQALNERLISGFVQYFDSINPEVRTFQEKSFRADRILTDAHFRALADPSQIMPKLRLGKSFEETAALALRSRAVVSELLKIRRELMKKS